MIGLDVAPGPYTQVVGSIAHSALVERVFKDHGVEAVIHAGALHKPDIACNPAQAFIDVNITGTLNLLNAAVTAGNDRFVFTSTTSLMISDAIRAGRAGGATQAAWLTEEYGPLEPRNIYGVTKRTAEHLCRLWHRHHGLGVAILRTSRFFPEDDDTHHDLAGENLKANEFLHRRLTVEDAARGHLLALDRAPALGCETFILSAPPPFEHADSGALINDAPEVIARYFPEARELYARRGWSLPQSIDRVYVPHKAERMLGWRAETNFAAVLGALAEDRPMPFTHDPSYLPPHRPFPTARGAR